MLQDIKYSSRTQRCRIISEGVSCGSPETLQNYDGDYVLIPQAIIGNNPYVIIKAKGTSMVGAGIDSGDELKVELTSNIYDGQIVVALINGEATVKTYICDERGNAWLMPCNDNYTPISVRDGDDVRILGKVVSVNKPVKLMTYAECSKMLKKAIRDKKLTEPMTEARIKKAITQILPMMKVGRYWYCIFRVLVDRGYYEETTDISTFVSDINDWFVDNDWNLSADDIRRMCVQSFRKAVNFWDKDDAPVTGKRFNDYLNIAQTFNKIL